MASPDPELTTRSNDHPITRSPDMETPLTPLEFMRRYRIPTFYDQGGTLVRRMGIRQMPAMVTQDKNTLRIEELKMN